MSLGSAENVSNESDVEQKIFYPLLTAPSLLAIPAESVKTKSYLAPTQIDKRAGRTRGYFPDYSIWIVGHPILVAEAKDPSVDAEVGFREARTYASELNARYQSGYNPCKFVLACNGLALLAGVWDQQAPVLRL